jgi:hypothetical protein
MAGYRTGCPVTLTHGQSLKLVDLKNLRG